MSSGFQAQPGWEWPSGLPGRFDSAAFGQESEDESGSDSHSFKTTTGGSASPRHGQQEHQQSQPRPRRFYRPRTCRICLETVNPTFHPEADNTQGIFGHSMPNVTYESEDGGRLLRPCKCKGSSRYVHEGCLQAWRHADPAYGKRNYWQCPTCGFRYRLERMAWGRIVSSAAAQVVLTLFIFFVVTFLLGFVADPIINLWVDPLGTLSPFLDEEERVPLFDDEPSTWIEHFVKGMASLGLMGFAKVILMSPFHWLNLRSARMVPGGRVGVTGRDRMANLSWVTITIGVATFLYGIWKSVRNWSRQTLEHAGERVMDVQADDEDDDDENEGDENSGFGNVGGGS
ncbi:hypothetical protein BDY21DRAFT_280657 [Lineolata rhizophorae]|uniref:RING-CH-type domain-containing protein n=1 Tax=Lineolata rhizophorae TaxID=578093 RepID=A0A6A6P8Q2_9PEZI|nr:hypothetical protein BDY21DRAFT_280657 [Lineolata rhizophorae]